MIDGYSTLDIIRALGIPREKLRAWMKDNFIVPTIPAQGQGTKAIFTLDRVYCIALFQSLLNRGFSRKVAAQVVDSFHFHAWYDCETRIFSNNWETNIHYIILQYETEEITKVPIITTLTNCSKEVEIKINLDNNGELKFAGASFTTTGKPKNYSGWRHLHIVDFKKIITEVNTALLG